MKFKNIIVSDDNQLVLEDYNLDSSECEILDLNKSLHDIVEDQELQKFVFDNAVDNNKIYFVCVKENFNSNDQRIENIPDIKALNKVLKKTFNKKAPNVYFFVYNTFMKNETAINPTLDIPSSIDAQPAKEVEVKDVVETSVEPVTSSEVEVIEEVKEVEPAVEEAKDEDFELEVETQEEQVEEVQEETKEEVEEIKAEEASEETEEVKEEEPEVEIELEQEETVELASEPQEEVVEEAIEVADETTIDEEVKEEELIEAQPEESSLDEVTEENKDDEIEVEVEAVEDVVVSEPVKEEIVEVSSETLTDDWSDIDNFDATEENEPTSDEDIFVEDDITSDDLANEVPIVDIVNNASFTNEVTTDLATTTSDLKVENFVDPKLKDEITVPESYYDVDSSDIDVSYEDYNEFTNDYELNVHTLKSLYDFIWRILVLNNYNLRLNDLLYLAVNNLEAFSIGQSDFVRQTSNKADSLFDLILQLDVKLEFNNSLFYIYLAEFFSIKANEIVVSDKFLDTLSIWVDKASKNRFVEQIQQFVNYSTVYNKKIIFSYFVELANFVKGCLPSIRPTLSLIDIHRILVNPSKKAREENVFSFMVHKMNQIFKEQGIIIESSLVETPENMFNETVNSYSEDASHNWKTQLTNLYKRLIENVYNYVLLKGNNETEIFNIYIDIKDLRMYKSVGESNLLSPQTLQALTGRNDSGYITIGDAFNRTQAIVPSQNEAINTPKYANVYLEEIKTNPDAYLPTNTQVQGQGYTMDENQLKRLESLYQQDNGSEVSYPTNPQSVIVKGLERTFDNRQTRFSIADFEDSMSRRIEEYEKKIKANIAKIEAERKQLREKMDELRNL